MKILLIADVHNIPHGSKRTLKSIKKVIKDTPCDLIVFLGDTVYGPYIKNDYEKYLRQVLDLTGDKPFATVFGNHDDECETTKEEILKVVQSYPNSLTNGRDYVVKMMGETLLFLDSGSYYGGEGSFYDTVKEEQITFAKEQIKGERAILFQHIIVPDIMDYVEAYRKQFLLFGKDCYRFKKSVKYTGKLREKPCPPDINTGELKDLSPNLKAACFGHDHLNDFELDVMGVKLIQCAGASYNSYDRFSRSNVKLLDTKTLKTKQIYI